MHVCFHGGAGDSKITKSISIIRGFTKNMKAMSLKVKVGGGGNHARARRRRWPEADDTVQDYKDVAAAAPAASASAKIAPAQLQEEADDDHQLHNEEEEEEQGGGKKQEYCDKCCSPLLDDGGGGGSKEETAAAAIVKAKEVAEESGREWVSEPEPGVVMTLAPRSDGTNRLRRIRFREALFDAWTAQSWWADNYDRVVELYSVVQSDDEEEEEAAAVPVTPCQSEEGDELPDGMTGAEESGSPWTSNFTGGSGSGGGSAGTVGSPILGLVTAPNTSGNGSTTTRAAQHDSTCQQPTTAWREWVEEYEAGVFITVRAYPDHHLQLRHVELSRERFGEVKARVWWQENKARLHHLYSF